MLSLAQYLAAKSIGKSEFARRLSKRLDQRVPPQSVHRWTLEIGDKDYSVPRAKIVEAINDETEGDVPPSIWYSNGVKTKRKPRAVDVSIVASRRAAATRRRQSVPAEGTVPFYKGPTSRWPKRGTRP